MMSAIARYAGTAPAALFLQYQGADASELKRELKRSRFGRLFAHDLSENRYPLFRIMLRVD
jgi:hypothetical protein